MNDVLYIAWRYLRYNWGKTIVLVASISLIVFLPAGLQVEMIQVNPGPVRFVCARAGEDIAGQPL